MTELILVTGATGTVGSETVRQLAGAGHRVRALVRDLEKAQALLPSTAELVRGDLAAPETLAPAFEGAERIFVVVNGPDLGTLEANAIEAAARAGARRIVMLSGRHLDAEFMASHPLVAAHAANEIRLKRLGIPWTILRPGLFASNFQLWLDRVQGTVSLPVGEGRDTPTDPRDIAAVAVAALTEPGHAGIVYELTGPDFVSYRDMVGEIAAALGRGIELVDVPRELARDGMVAAGVPRLQAEGLLNYFDGVRAGQIYPPTTTIADVLGRPARPFDAWVHDHLATLQ